MAEPELADPRKLNAIVRVLREAFALGLDPVETIFLVRRRHPGVTNDQIMTAFQSRLAEIAREKAIATDWHARECRKLDRLMGK